MDNIKFELKKHNKNNDRVFIRDDLLKEYNILDNTEIYYTVVFDLVKHESRLYITDSVVKKDSVIFQEKKVIKKNTFKSRQLVFYLDKIYSLIFDLKNKDFVSLVECPGDAFLFEFVFS